MALIVIPARFGSKRFPGKPLVKIFGKEMVLHVYERALKSKYAKEVIIATDDERIFNCAQNYGAKVVMTSKDIKSGTDRVWEVAKKLNYEIIVNLQGDEPLIDPSVIDKAILCIKSSENIDISTPVKLINNEKEIKDPNIVKAVFNENNFAIYFSRSPVPYYRDNKIEKKYFKHIGLYCFKREALEKFVSLPQSKLEKIEKLEQLRAIENGLKIKVFITEYDSISIDTPEDLKRLLSQSS